MSRDEHDIAQRMAQLERLIGDVERLEDVELRGKMRAIVSAVLELHGAGLERLLTIAAGSAGPGARAFHDGIARDPLVSSLLLLHGLHPRDLESRVRAALAELAAPADEVELLEIKDGLVRVQVRSPALKALVEQALVAAAPDAAGFAIDVAAPLIPAARLQASARR
jgi:hypothetical protein